MNFKIPKNTEKYYWTKHSIIKMRQYGLSGQRIIRIIRAPKRIETGIAKNTVAVMQPTSTRRGEKGEITWKNEIWVMYRIGKVKKEFEDKYSFLNGGSPNLSKIISGSQKQLKIISAWKYPGVSPRNNPIPEEILYEIENIV